MKIDYNRYRELQAHLTKLKEPTELERETLAEGTAPLDILDDISEQIEEWDKTNKELTDLTRRIYDQQMVDATRARRESVFRVDTSFPGQTVKSQIQ